LTNIYTNLVVCMYVMYSSYNSPL